MRVPLESDFLRRPAVDELRHAHGAHGPLVLLALGLAAAEQGQSKAIRPGWGADAFGGQAAVDLRWAELAALAGCTADAAREIVASAVDAGLLVIDADDGRRLSARLEPDLWRPSKPPHGPGPDGRRRSDRRAAIVEAITRGGGRMRLGDLAAALGVNATTGGFKRDLRALRDAGVLVNPVHGVWSLPSAPATNGRPAAMCVLFGHEDPFPGDHPGYCRRPGCGQPIAGTPAPHGG